MELKTTISGEKELLATFHKLPRTTRTRVVRPALREGAAYIRNLAEKNVKAVAIRGYATGTLEKNIRFYNLKDFRGMARVAVTVRRGAVNQHKIIKGEPVRVGLYAAVLEYGKKNQPPQSWIRKSAREGKDPAVAIITVAVGKRIDSAVNEAKR